jgi:phenylacetate-CoA ligase
VAKYINSNNIKLEFTPIAIFTTSETLYPSYRAEIEKAFGCKIYDQYASSEGSTFITECEHGNLHIGEDTGIIEWDDNGDMLITSFFTYGTPLIRYKIGDRIKPKEDEFDCQCNIALKTVDSIEGRSMDYLVSKSHGKFTAIHLSVSVELLSTKVKAAQFVQNSIDTIDIFLETESDYNTIEDKILLDELSYKMGSDMNFVFHHVSCIPKEENGKFRFIKNNLNINTD